MPWKVKPTQIPDIFFSLKPLWTHILFCQALLVQLGPKEALLPLHDSNADSAKVQEVVRRSNILVTERKKGTCVRQYCLSAYKSTRKTHTWSCMKWKWKWNEWKWMNGNEWKWNRWTMMYWQCVLHKRECTEVRGSFLLYFSLERLSSLEASVTDINFCAFSVNPWLQSWLTNWDRESERQTETETERSRERDREKQREVHREKQREG